MEQDDTPESLASGSSSTSAPASRFNAAALKPRPVAPHHGNEPRRRGPHHPGEGEGIAAVAAEEEGPAGAGQAQPRLIEAPQSRPQLIEAEARKVLKKVEFYFSDIILATTKRLRKFITNDPNGFVPISEVAALTKFPKIVLVAALWASSELVASEDGKKVKRVQPFIAEEVQSRIVVAENLPVDHKNLPVDQKHVTVVNFFSSVGRVRSVRIYHPHDGAAASSKALMIGMPFSRKLHAFVEFASVGDAVRAVAEYSDGGKWRDGFRVRSLLSCLKHGLGEGRISGDEGSPHTSGRLHDYGTDIIARVLEAHFEQDVLEDGKKVLLKTPSGFALFYVEEVAMKEDKNIWMYFADSCVAQQVLLLLGFVKARPTYDGATSPGDDFCNLIQKFCKSGEELYVEDPDLKMSVEDKFDVFCICDGDTVSELLWGIKNVLHEFIHEEKDNVTAECLPLSKELIKALQYYLINISTKMVDRSFVSTFGYLCYIDMNLKAVAKDLRNSYDRFIALSEAIEDDLTYAKVVALALVPEFVQHYDFYKDFCKDLIPELSLKLVEAIKFKFQSGGTEFTWYDIKRIVGALDYLLEAPRVRDKILTRIKLMEASRFRSEAYQIINDMRVANGYDAIQRIDETHSGDHVDFGGWKFTRTLLETPSGFAIFDVCEVVFQHPTLIWTCFSDTCDARKVAFALGFVKVEDKSVAFNNITKSGDKLRDLILRFCCKEKKLFVQNNELKDIIESKLDVCCWTHKLIAGELMWGLSFVLSDFIVEESDNMSDAYIPPSKILQRAMEEYNIDLSPSKIDRDFIYSFSHVVNLDVKLKNTIDDLYELIQSNPLKFELRICEYCYQIGIALRSFARLRSIQDVDQVLLGKLTHLVECMPQFIPTVPGWEQTFATCCYTALDACNQKYRALKGLPTRGNTETEGQDVNLFF